MGWRMSKWRWVNLILMSVATDSSGDVYVGHNIGVMELKNRLIQLKL